MTDESQGIDLYEAVLADLRAKREQIDTAIAVIESLRGGVVPRGLGSGISLSSLSLASEAGEGAGAYLGLSIPEATKKLLASRKQALGNADIVAGLKAGGIAMGSRDPVNTIGSILGRRFDQVGDIVRVSRGTWGLKEWYPGKTFKKQGKSALSDLEEADALIDEMEAETPSA